MTYHPHIKVEFGGRLFVTEIWSCSLRMLIGSQVAGVPADNMLGLWEQWTRDNLNDIAADVATYITTLGAGISNQAYLDFVKVNVIGADGRYRSQSQTVAKYYTPAAAPKGSTTPTHGQLSVAVSLVTAAARGRAHRGRFYAPTGAVQVDGATGKIAGGAQSNMATAAAQLITNLNNQPGLDLNSPRVVVASDLGEPGPIRDVIAVEVGDVVDTQRRRRNNQKEVYTRAAVVID